MFYISSRVYREDREKWGTCEEPRSCTDKGELFWPKDKRCYRKYTKGPCTEGQLLVASTQNDLIGDCKCENIPELATYYWAPTGSMRILCKRVTWLKRKNLPLLESGYCRHVVFFHLSIITWN